MNQIEIKAWLKWFVENIDAAFIYEASDKQTYYEYEFKEEAKTIAYAYGNEPIKLNRLLQLAIQEEIKVQRWRFTLTTGLSFGFLVIISDSLNPAKFLGSSKAETIVEAFMLAFLEAYETPHNT